MSTKAKQILTAAVCVLAIAASGLWIYLRDFRAPKYDVALHQRVGEVMAEQTANVTGGKGKIVLMTIPTRGLPELKTELDSFRAALKKLGSLEIKEYEMDP